MFNVNVGAKGFYRLQTATQDTGWFENLITTAGLDKLGNPDATSTDSDSSVDLFYGIDVGTGTTPPAFTDTALTAGVAKQTWRNFGSSANGFKQDEQGKWCFYFRRTHRYNPGEVVGNISEVGVYTGTSIGFNAWKYWGPLFSHTLVKDAEGLPTTITVTAIDYLDIDYEVRFYLTEDVLPFSVTISTPTGPVVHDCTVKRFREYWGLNWRTSLRAYSGSTPANETVLPAGMLGAEVFNILFHDPNYVPGTFTKSHFATFPITSGNGAIKTIVLSTIPFGKWYLEFTPAINKNNTQSFRLDYTVTWGRV